MYQLIDCLTLLQKTHENTLLRHVDMRTEDQIFSIALLVAQRRHQEYSILGGQEVHR